MFHTFTFITTFTYAAKSEMMGMTTVFNASGVDKEDFVKYTEANPATYRVGIPQLKPPIFVSDTNLKKKQDWSRTWDQETTGKEDDLKSPYLDRCNVSFLTILLSHIIV